MVGEVGHVGAETGQDPVHFGLFSGKPEPAVGTAEARGIVLQAFGVSVTGSTVSEMSLTSRPNRSPSLSTGSRTSAKTAEATGQMVEQPV